MKVLHIIERFNPNLGQEINFIARNKAKDIEMHILTSTSLKPWSINNYKEVLKDDNHYKSEYDVTIIREDPFFEFGEKLWLKRLNYNIRNINPDIVYSHGIEYITFIRLIGLKFLSKKASYKIFTDTHSLPVFANGTVFRMVYYSLLRRFIFPLVNKYHIVSFYTAEENRFLLENIYKINPKFIKPFLIGADLKTFIFNSEDRDTLRQKYNISNEEILIIFSGRICSQKGPHLILEAIRNLSSSVTKRVSLLLIGFQDEFYINNSINQQIPDSIRVIIELPKPSYLLPGYYSAADFAVFPLESTLSSLECQACRLPVIMESNPTNNQRLKKGGLLYEIGNIQDLAEKIVLMINDDLLRKKLSEEGYAYVCQYYDYLRNLRQMESFLRE